MSARIDQHCRCWSTPLRAGAKSYGLLCLALDGAHPLGEDSHALMEGIAQQVAAALQNARLQEERAHLEAERRLELLRGEFLASVSHELRTPLGFIKGYAGTLLREDVTWDPHQQRTFLETIDQESDHLTELVESLLEAARLQAGHLRLKYDTVDLEQVARRAIDRIAGSLAAGQIQLHTGPIAAIVGDAGRLEQVVLNLLQNAAKYSPDGATIELRLGTEGNEVRLGVLDRGIGIATADAQRIFEPFFRAQSGDPTIGGAGLGLAVCRAIVEAHGGRVWAEPRDSGGTAFYVALPMNAPDQTITDPRLR